MNRKLSKTQRAILEHLKTKENGRESLSDITKYLNYYDIKCWKIESDAYASVSRVARQLVKLGYVKMFREYEKQHVDCDDKRSCMFVELIN